ncbi:MAG TPA: 1-acyl-sn-glycerol-3-phosphate acyltransferase [Candidatus Obscuribacterales bacterium]
MSSEANAPPTPNKRAFLPAKPDSAFIAVAQNIAGVDLALNNQVEIDPDDLSRLKQLPKNAGIILMPNHADEVDPRICLELSRRCAKRFILMCNREAFDEYSGLAGWALQRLGYFSVERGAHDTAAKDFAIDVLKNAQEVLVLFPEGEIYYLNENIQPFHSGGVEICMQAMIQNRQSRPDFSIFAVPMAIKYTYPQPIDRILDQRVQKMEHDLSLTPSGATMQKRLHNIFQELLKRQQLAHNLADGQPTPESATQLSLQVKNARRAILEQVEQKYSELSSGNRPTIDQSWQLGAKLRAMIDDGAENKTEIRRDLSALNEVAHMVSWQPKYIVSNPSRDRMAEVVLKLERELYRIKRPRQLAKRHVHVRIADPIDLSKHLSEYCADPHTVRHNLTQQLQETVQQMIDGMVPLPGRRL